MSCLHRRVGSGASTPPSSSCCGARAASSNARENLTQLTLSRHTYQQTRQLRCATFKVHSLANKVDIIRQCWLDSGLDVLGLTRPVRPGSKIDDVYYQNYGGVAVVASAAVRLTKFNAPFEPVTFEHLIARVTVAGSSFTAAFFNEFRVLLEHLSSFATPYVITGDLNIRFDRPGDLLTLRATELL